MIEELKNIKESAINDLNNCNTIAELNDLKSKYLGKKSSFTTLMSGMSSLSNEEKKEFGSALNNTKNDLSVMFESKNNEINDKLLNERLERDKIDLSLPSKKRRRGTKHPLTIVQENIEDLFISMGYDVCDGPEVEQDLYNFEMLNLPVGHPARDMQDTFYITNDMLLRTHTSPMQVRYMLSLAPKRDLKMICPGKVFRRDDDDATHSHQFTQIEGLVVGKNISLADLKGTLEELAKKIFGEGSSVRFRPSYFPFTEPSYEVDISCFKCGGKGCSLCKSTGWIEVLGSGMVHPNVLKGAGFDPDVYTGYAFGMGVERIAMLKYGITDLRLFYANDFRFLNNFDMREN